MHFFAKIGIFLSLSFFAFFVIAGFPATTANAQEVPCDNTVYDQNRIFGSKSGDVNSAVKSLENEGAIVRVIALQSYNKSQIGSLENMAKAFVSNCPSWQAPGGGTKTTLVSVIFAVDNREMLVWAGSFWDRGLTSQAKLNIQNDVMAPEFRSGDYAGGVTAALREITKIADSQNNSNVSGSGVEQPTNTVINEKPTDLTGLWYVFGGLLVIGLFVVLALVVININAGRDQAKRVKAQARSRLQQVVNTINELGTKIPDIDSRMDTLSLIPETNKDSLEVIQARLNKLRNNYSWGSSAMSTFNKSGDPTSEGRSKAEYESASYDLEKILAPLRDALVNASWIVEKLEILEADPTTLITAEKVSPEVVVVPKQEREVKYIDLTPPQSTRTESISVRDAEQAIERANDAVRDAERYFREYWRYIGFEAKNELIEAKSELDAAENETNPQVRYQKAHSARRSVTNASESARRNVARGDDYSGRSGYSEPWGPWYQDNENVVFLPLPYPDSRGERRDRVTTRERDDDRGRSTGWSDSRDEERGSSRGFDSSPDEDRGSSSSWGSDDKEDNNPSPSVDLGSLFGGSGGGSDNDSGGGKSSKW